MNTRVSALESWKIAEDAARKAVSEYRKQEESERMTKLTSTEKQEWLKVAKQIGVVLGIVIVILYAYAATKGIRL